MIKVVWKVKNNELDYSQMQMVSYFDLLNHLI